MDAVLVRCEIQAGLLQAQRQRTGFIERDATPAIEVATQAQGMAERLNDSNSIGRANFWRGVAEWMAGESQAAEEFFGISASYGWAKESGETKLLHNWLHVSRTEEVNRTARNDPNLTSQHRSSWLSKEKPDSEKNDKVIGSKPKHKKKWKHPKHKGMETAAPSSERSIYQEVLTHVEQVRKSLTNPNKLRKSRILGQLAEGSQQS
jgi:hypothetical protein